MFKNHCLKYIVPICLSFIICACANNKEIYLVGFENRGCDEIVALEDELQLEDQISDLSIKGDNLLLTILFTETCGFVIDPELIIKNDTILVKLDKEIDNDKVERLYAFCLCCYSVTLELANINKDQAHKLTYQIRKLDELAKTIVYTKENYLF